MNLMQRIWLELIKDYDIGINYHHEKANVLAEAFSRRSHANHLVLRKMTKVYCGT
jgi:hypothetical protein